MDQTPRDHARPELAPGGASRRHLLGLAVVAGAGLPVLAACGGDGDNATSGSSGGGSSESGSGGAATGPLVATSKVPVNGGVILGAERVVVTQPTAGTFKAFTAVCTHQGCVVSGVEDGVIGCRCHGSAFSARDGSVESGPATRALAEIPVTVQDGEVVTA